MMARCPGYQDADRKKERTKTPIINRNDYILDPIE